MRINFEIPSDLHEALKRQADAQGRTVSDVMRQLIVEFIDKDTERVLRSQSRKEKP